MEVQVISKTVQKFNGESFYLCGMYFQHKGKRLHRAVWEYYNGKIPKGYHIHHKDGDRCNNDISNLTLLEGKAHLSEHMSNEERKSQSRESIKQASQFASIWNGSEDGKKWHSQHAKEYWKNAPINEYVCSFCGKSFKTRYVYSSNSNRFCHPNCKASYRRRRLRNEG